MNFGVTAYIYPWCTIGGVERCLINRAIALRTAKIQGQLVAHFPGGGDIARFRNAISYYGVSHILKVSERPVEADRYVFIDDHDHWHMIQNGAPAYFECHTTYPENQRRLTELPPFIQALLVPSGQFREEIRHLVDPKIPINVLHNYVLKSHAAKSPVVRSAPEYFIFGRMDSWKNDGEALAIFKRISELQPDAFFHISGNQAPTSTYFKKVEDAGLLGRTHLYPMIPFEGISMFLNKMHSRGAVFVSSSRGESFGLAASEAMAQGIAVVLSNVRGHRALVNDDESILYRLGDIEHGAEQCIATSEQHHRQADRALEHILPFQDPSAIETLWASTFHQVPAIVPDPYWSRFYSRAELRG